MSLRSLKLKTETAFLHSKVDSVLRMGLGNDAFLSLVIVAQCLSAKLSFENEKFRRKFSWQTKNFGKNNRRVKREFLVI